MYQVGDFVVYPAQGVGRISCITTKTLGGQSCEFYTVLTQDAKLTILVPVKNAHNVGLRPLIDATQAQSILDTIQYETNIKVSTGQNWNRRFRDYSEKLKSTDLCVVAGILRELLVIGRDKSLSYGERRIQEQAMNLVCGEIALVLKLDEAEIKAKILKIYEPTPKEEPVHVKKKASRTKRAPVPLSPSRFDD